MKPTREQLHALEQILIDARGRVQVAVVDEEKSAMLLVETRELVLSALQQLGVLLVTETPPRCVCPAPDCPVHRGRLAAW